MSYGSWYWKVTYRVLFHSIANYRTLLLALRGYVGKRIRRNEAIKLIYYDVFLPNVIGYMTGMFILEVLYEFVADSVLYMCPLP